MTLEKWHEIAEHKSQPRAELQTGISWAADLGVLEFDGLEAAKFLQGYLTCDTEALPAGVWQPTALCNLKGRVVANGWVAADTQGSLWLLVHQSLAKPCLDFLHKYLVFAKAEGHNRSTEMAVIMGHGQEASGPTAVSCALEFNQTQDPKHKTWLSLTKVDEAIALWQQAPTPVTSNQLRTALLAAGLALVTSHSSEQFLPQMLGLAAVGAIDFDKGCYLGQEIVARAQHRGSVKRQLARLEWQPTTSAPVPSNLDAVELMDSTNRNLGKIINWQVVQQASGTLMGMALAVVSIKDEALPSTLTQSDAASAGPVDKPNVFQVYKIEN